MGNLLYQLDRHIDFKSSVSSTNKWRVFGKKKKKIRTVREREILVPLLTDLERFGHRSSTGGCKRLVEANFWAITAWTLRLCKRNFLVFSFSIWRDLVKGFYFFLRKIIEDQVILILQFLFGSLSQFILLLPSG